MSRSALAIVAMLLVCGCSTAPLADVLDAGWPGGKPTPPRATGALPNVPVPIPIAPAATPVPRRPASPASLDPFKQTPAFDAPSPFVEPGDAPAGAGSPKVVRPLGRDA